MKKVLLDTHTFIWWIENAPQLSANAIKLIEDVKNECYLSLASSWEMAIKASIGKLKFSLPLHDYIPHHMTENNFTQLNISFRHVSKVESLPWHHRDPFDRLLAVQAIEEKMVMVSADKIFDEYEIARIW